MKKIFLMVCLVLGASPVAIAQEQDGKALSPLTALSSAEARYVFGDAGQTPATPQLSMQEMENTHGGSHCRAYVSKATGQQYEICRPPY